jgi:hypothetical protein
MKTEFVCIYTEEELQHKVRHTEALLRHIKEQVSDFHFCDIPALKDMWIQYKLTHYIVSESMLLEDQYYREDSTSLFVERLVEDDYSNDLIDPDSLHNGLVSMQFLYDSIQGYLSFNAYDIHSGQYQNPQRLVKEIATDIYLHLNPTETNEYPKMVDILEYLNYIYLFSTDNDYIELVDVAIAASNKEQEGEKIFQKLIDTLDLQLDFLS